MRLEVLDMTLTKIKIGNLITDFNIKNTDNIDYPFYGINIDKEFMPSAASTDSVDRSKYKIVKKGVFVFSGMQTGRDCCIRIAMYEKDDIVLVSPAYTTFTVTSPAILPEYLFMYFRSNEKDRYGAFLSDGSIRSNLDWDVFCDIEIELPSIEIQRKYVEIYKSIVENQAAYETGLEDLKMVCDGCIDKLKNMNAKVKIGNYIEQIDNRNKHNLSYKFSGLSMENYFIESIADSNELDFSKYKIVQPNEYGAVLMKVGRDCRLTIARNTSQENLLISPAYYTFKTHDIMPEYFMANVNRSEFERRGWFFCDSSARGSLSWDLFVNLEIPYVSEKDQRKISNLYSVMIERNEINNKLKQLIMNICPVLIKGAVEEAKRS